MSETMGRGTGRGLHVTTNTDNPTEVRLSLRDWFGILGVAGTILVTLLIAGVGAYLRHDRILTEIAAGQRHQVERIQQLEDDISRLEDTLFRTGDPRP